MTPKPPLADTRLGQREATKHLQLARELLKAAGDRSVSLDLDRAVSPLNRASLR